MATPSRFQVLVAAAVFGMASVGSAADEVASYRIEVALDPASHRLTAVQFVEWTNTTTIATDELYLHLYLNAFAGPETTFMRELRSSPWAGVPPPDGGWGWTRISRLTLPDGSDLLPGLEFARPDDGNPGDFTVARVPLPREVLPGARVRLQIAFEAQLPQVVSRTGHVGDFHLVGQWFPKLGVFEGEDGWNCHQFHAGSEFFADFGSYRVAVTVPERWLVGATGVEIGRETAADGRQTLIYRAERVHDFAWCAAPPDLMQIVEAEFEPGRDVPMPWLEKARARLGLSAAELELPPMSLRLMIPRTHEALAPRMLRAARLAVAWFGLHFGAWPYPQLTVVSPPPGAEAAGGMEYPTFITTGADRLDAFWPFAWSSDIESLTVHEFGHQYFYGLLASNEFEEAWLDEGLTSWAETACMSDIVADRLAPDIHPYSYWGAERFAFARSLLPLTPARRSWEFRSADSYYLASYTKTALALETVEGLIGAAAFARGLRAYVERHAFAHPTGSDLVAALGEAAGRDLAPFFAQAIWGDEIADWGVSAVRHRGRREPQGLLWDGSEWRPAAGAASAAGAGPGGGPWLVEVELVRRGDFLGPVVVELGWDGGSTERRVWEASERWVRWLIDSDRRLEQVIVDPDGVWALETRRADNYWRERPAGPDHPLWWLREALALAGRLFLRSG